MNKVFLQGHLGQDPELKFSKNGNPFMKVSLSTKERVRNGNEWRDETAWHRLVIFGKRAESLSKYIKKGASVLAWGRIQYSSWEGRDGIKRVSTDIICEEIRLMASRAPRNSSNAEEGEGNDDFANGGAILPPDAGDYDNDDIPF